MNDISGQLAISQEPNGVTHATSNGLYLPAIAPGTSLLHAAQQYAEAGWYVLPIRAGDKNPGSIVKDDWPSKSSRDPQQLGHWFAGKNPRDRGIGLHVGKSGAVVLDVDNANDPSMPTAVAVALSDPSVPMQRSRWRSADKFDASRGHLFYLQPKSGVIGNSAGQLEGGWGDVRGTNGFLVAAPTLREDGSCYFVQRSGLLTPFPAGLYEAMTAPRETAAGRTGVPRRTGGGRTNAPQAHHGEASDEQRLMALRFIQEEADKLAAMRHGSKRNNALHGYAINAATMRHLVPKETARQLLLEDACSANGLIERDGPAACAATFESGYANGEAKPERVITGGAPPVIVHELDIDDAGDPPSRPPWNVEHIENGFWTERESLKRIYDVSLGRLCSPWGVLGAVLARTLVNIPPGVALPPITGGGRGSLNINIGLVAPSGGGKSATDALAAELMPTPQSSKPFGTGEGIVTAFDLPTDSEDSPAFPIDALLFVADEVDGLVTLMNRSGATLQSVIKTAFTGGELGFTNKQHRTAGGKKIPQAVLAAQAYRLCAIVCIQPGKAGPILGESAGGTPQRLLWVPAVDSRISIELASEDYLPLTPFPTQWHGGARKILKVPRSARDAIVAARAEAGSGAADADPDESHSLFMREKVSMALAFLDGRDWFGEDDWRLAGVVMAVSTHSRRATAAALEAFDKEERNERSQKRGEDRSAEMAAADGETHARRAGWLKTAGDAVKDAGSLSHRKLGQKFNGRVRMLALAVVSEHFAEVGIRRDGDTGAWVPA